MIGGIVKFSLIDYPDKISCVLFLSGCNFRCPYCHNRPLVLNQTDGVSYEELKQFLESRKQQLEGVVITGGEPTINPNFMKVITLAKSLGYSIKLDTNGTRPDVLKELIDKALVDYIAMDIKTTTNYYQQLTKYNKSLNGILESIDLLLHSTIDYEFRTTVVNNYHHSLDFNEIGCMIKGAKKYVLQNYRYSKNQIKEEQLLPFTKQKLEKAKTIMNNYVSDIIIK
ncbi:anaerobic ribonucleoside-triphosphate reductase activating protein [Mycoplasmatota bacterium]|nr:anaerobic ribonucleoside-triphosphate reductase activating protein [Mycoplasmatota bacterium]